MNAADLITTDEFLARLGASEETRALVRRLHPKGAKGREVRYPAEAVERVRAELAKAIEEEEASKPPERSVWLVRDRSTPGHTILEIHLDREEAESHAKAYEKTTWTDEDGKKHKTRAYVEKRHAVLHRVD